MDGTLARILGYKAHLAIVLDRSLLHPWLEATARSLEDSSVKLCTNVSYVKIAYFCSKSAVSPVISKLGLFLGLRRQHECLIEGKFNSFSSFSFHYREKKCVRERKLSVLLVYLDFLTCRVAFGKGGICVAVDCFQGTPRELLTPSTRTLLHSS